ncbi:MAG TPA: hypothetical protein VMU33_05830 [Burkholderiaceae bacterium]|nr:hypothetical protein [Burkholderiaceae bacterium]
MGLLDLLAQAASGLGQPEQHFDKVAQQATPDQLGQGISAALRSDQTPPFGQMVGQLFGQSNGAQQAGMLNQIIAALGPAALSGVAGGALSNMLAPGQTQITPQQASQLTPQQVQAIATHAEQQQPGIVDQLGRFYADHPTLVKTLGGAALAIALSKMKDSLAS